MVKIEKVVTGDWSKAILLDAVVLRVLRTRGYCVGDIVRFKCWDDVRNVYMLVPPIDMRVVELVDVEGAPNMIDVEAEKEPIVIFDNVS